MASVCYATILTLSPISKQRGCRPTKEASAAILPKQCHYLEDSLRTTEDPTPAKQTSIGEECCQSYLIAHVFYFYPVVNEISPLFPIGNAPYISDDDGFFAAMKLNPPLLDDDLPYISVS